MLGGRTIWSQRRRDGGGRGVRGRPRPQRRRQVHPAQGDPRPDPPRRPAASGCWAARRDRPTTRSATCRSGAASTPPCGSAGWTWSASAWTATGGACRCRAGAPAPPPPGYGNWSTWSAPAATRTGRSGSCSGGEQQRLLIAQALARRPKLLLLDEPLDSLDLPNQAAVAALISRIARAENVAVMIVAHDVNPILTYLDRVIYLGQRRRRVRHPRPGHHLRRPSPACTAPRSRYCPHRTDASSSSASPRHPPCTATGTPSGKAAGHERRVHLEPARRHPRHVVAGVHGQRVPGRHHRRGAGRRGRLVHGAAPAELRRAHPGPRRVPRRRRRGLARHRAGLRLLRVLPRRRAGHRRPAASAATAATPNSPRSSAPCRPSRWPPGCCSSPCTRVSSTAPTRCCSAASSASPSSQVATLAVVAAAALAVLAVIGRPLLFASIDTDVAARTWRTHPGPGHRLPAPARCHRRRGQPDHRRSAGLRAAGPAAGHRAAASPPGRYAASPCPSRSRWPPSGWRCSSPTTRRTRSGSG